jgi:hypothetical protein
MPANKSVSWTIFTAVDASQTDIGILVIMTDNTRRTIRYFPSTSMLEEGVQYTGEMQRLDVSGKLPEKESLDGNGKEVSLTDICHKWGIKGLKRDPKRTDAWAREFGKTMNTLTVLKESTPKRDGLFVKVCTASNPSIFDKDAKMEGPPAATPAAAHTAWCNKWNAHFNGALHFRFPASKDQETNSDNAKSIAADLFVD